MYYVIDSYCNKVIDTFECILHASEYVLHIVLDYMVEKNDFITPIVSAQRWWVVNIPIGYTKHDNLFKVSHYIIQKVDKLQHLFEYNIQYQTNKKQYTKWLQQSRHKSILEKHST